MLRCHSDRSQSIAVAPTSRAHPALSLLPYDTLRQQDGSGATHQSGTWGWGLRALPMLLTHARTQFLPALPSEPSESNRSEKSRGRSAHSRFRVRQCPSVQRQQAEAVVPQKLEWAWLLVRGRRGLWLRYYWRQQFCGYWGRRWTIIWGIGRPLNARLINFGTKEAFLFLWSDIEKLLSRYWNLIKSAVKITNVCNVRAYLWRWNQIAWLKERCVIYKTLSRRKQWFILL